MVVVFASLTLQHYYPSTLAYGLIALTAGMTLGVFSLKRLWSGLRGDWIGLSLIALVFILCVLLPVLKYVMQSPSLFISAMVFGGLIIGVLNARLPETVERHQASDL
jgi:hypothetical protein